MNFVQVCICWFQLINLMIGCLPPVLQYFQMKEESEEDFPYYANNQISEQISQKPQGIILQHPKITVQHTLTKKPKSALEETITYLKGQLTTPTNAFNLPNFPYEKPESQSQVLTSFVRDWVNRMIKDGQPVQLFMEAICNSLASYNDREWFDKHMTVTLAALKKRNIRPKILLPRMYIQKDEKEVKQMVRDAYSCALSGSKKMLKELMAKNYTWKNPEGPNKLKSLEQWSEIVEEIKRNRYRAMGIFKGKMIDQDQEQEEVNEDERNGISGVIMRNKEMEETGKKFGDTLYVLQYKNTNEVQKKQGQLRDNRVGQCFVLMVVLNQQSLPLITAIGVFQSRLCCFQEVDRNVEEGDLKSKKILELILQNTIHNKWLKFTPKSIIQFVHTVPELKETHSKFIYKQKSFLQEPYPYEPPSKFTFQKPEDQNAEQIVIQQVQPLLKEENSSDSHQQNFSFQCIPVAIVSIKNYQSLFETAPSPSQQAFFDYCLTLYKYLIADIFSLEINLSKIFIIQYHADLYKAITLFLKMHKVFQSRYKNQVELQSQLYGGLQSHESLVNMSANYILESKYPMERGTFAWKIVNGIRSYIKSYRITVSLYKIAEASQKFIMQPLSNQNIQVKSSEKIYNFPLSYVCKYEFENSECVVSYDLQKSHWVCQCGFIYLTGLPCAHLIKIVTHYKGSLLYYINEKYRYEEISPQIGLHNRYYSYKLKQQQQENRSRKSGIKKQEFLRNSSSKQYEQIKRQSMFDR